MSDESNEIEPEAGTERRGLSRRAALKAGVVTGVGVAAWSGVSITSLGGTPAYAVGCTGVIVADLASGCRNQPQDCDDFAYQPLEGNPPGFTIGTPAHPNIGNNVCCDANTQIELVFDSNLQCDVFLDIYDNNGDCGKLENRLNRFLLGQGSSGSLLFTLGCQTGKNPSQKYTIKAFCNSIGAPQECLTQHN